MKRLTLALLLLSSAVAFAQGDTRTINTLDARPVEESQERKNIRWHRDKDIEDNDVDFIVEDAFLDGFIKGAKPFDIWFIMDSLTINHKPIPEPYNTRYIATTNAMLDRLHIPADKRVFHIYSPELGYYADLPKGTPPTLLQLSNVGKDCRQKVGTGTTVDRYFDPQEYSNFYHQFANDSTLVANLCNDHIISKPAKVSIRCNSKGCKLNTAAGTPLPDKYLQLVTAVTNKRPTDENDFVGVSYKAEDFRRYSGCKE